MPDRRNSFNSNSSPAKQKSSAIIDSDAMDVVEVKKKAAAVSDTEIIPEANGVSNGHTNGHTNGNADPELNGDDEVEVVRPPKERKTYKYKDPPVVFKDVDVSLSPRHFEFRRRKRM